MNLKNPRLCTRLFALILLIWMTGLPPAMAAFENEGPVDFTLELLGGGQASPSDYRGEWVVVNYWATWCAPCRKEIPELSELHEARGDVTVLGLAYEETEDAEFEKFLQEFHASYPILKVDVQRPPKPFGAPRVLPTTIILDRGGRPVKSFLGPVTRQAIEDFIDGSDG
ncbi:MAG: TlpA disulfide reductase family protein [Xanthomonadales bacterium]|nr:TlpA disulfide reductase family protein [Xanthomonadales bacterium]